MKEIYILRHGLAVERGTRGYAKDSDRPLTPEGRKKMRRIGKTMRQLDLAFDLILSSPYVRARQTAEIVAKALRAEKLLKFSEHLAAGGDAEELVEQLRKLHHSPPSILLVGHEPYLSQLISVLLSGAPDLALTLKKGGLCKLTAPRLTYTRCATLEWLLAPRHMI
ncbi:MAG: phosphohistidine phosphatase SixA [Verrucomicrobiales bacterium]|nr:phosphohistidine phosphatase SixA [Verrucomicrobiales bacterium]